MSALHANGITRCFECLGDKNCAHVQVMNGKNTQQLEKCVKSSIL